MKFRIHGPAGKLEGPNPERPKPEKKMGIGRGNYRNIA